jgi:hypothetical protein
MKHRSLLLVERQPDKLLDRFEEYIALHVVGRFERSRT